MSAHPVDRRWARRRRVYRVQYHRRTRRWEARQSRLLVISMPRKADVVRWTRHHLRWQWSDRGELCQLVIHGKDGRIQTEHTYGRDPRRSKG
jgi:hypothetical protein